MADGIVWLFYVNRYGPTWSNSRIKFKVSRDGAKTWSDSDMISFDEGTMVRARPIALNNGDYLLPAYRETGNDPEFVGDTGSYFYRMKKGTHDSGAHEVDSFPLRQPSTFSGSDYGRLSCCLFSSGGRIRAKGSRPLDSLGIARRRVHLDAGTESQFPNPNAATDFIKLRNGHLLLVYNDNENSTRMPLTAAISTDGDRSYPFKRNIVNKPRDSAAYPTAIQTRDGKIHVVYTSESRSLINHAIFDEAAILSSGER